MAKKIGKIWAKALDMGDTISPFMGIAKGGIDASKTLCQAEEQINQLNKSIIDANNKVKEIKAYDNQLTDEHSAIMKRMLASISESQDSVFDLQDDFDETKQLMVITTIVVLCVVVVLLAAKRLGFLKPTSILTMFSIK